MVNGEFYVTSRCRYWLATVPSLPRDPRVPEDVDTKANDHFLDATSYAIAGESGGAVRIADFRGRPAKEPHTTRVIYV